MRKVAGGVTTLYFYDAAGHRVEEQKLSTSPAARRTYVFVEDEPMGIVDQPPSGAPVFSWIHTDRLGTPLAVTSTPASGSAQTIWRASYEPFGLATPDGDPDGDSQSFALDLRFPGQVFDAETGGHDNFFRTYDPGTGRYLEADPIGQLGIVRDATARADVSALLADDAIDPAPAPSTGGGSLQADSSELGPELAGLLTPDPQELNLYQYAFNDPVNAFDANGLRAAGAKRAACGALNATVQLCKATLRRCRGGESCAVLRGKQAAFTGCAAARYAFSRFCKGGPDPGHQRAIAAWKAAAERCGRLASQASCSCFGN